MSESTTTPERPRHVTAASWMIMVGSVFVVLMVWDRIAGLHSLDSQQSLQSMLDSPGVKGSGLQVADLMVLVKTVSMVAAACATAMAILGYQTLQRSRSARLVLTVLAVPLFVSGLVTGGLVSSAVAAAVATLWLGPARDWFDGKAPSQATSSTARTPVWPPPLPAPPPHQEPVAGPDPARPSDQPHTEQPTAHPQWPYAQAQQQQPLHGSVGWAPPPTSAYGAGSVARAGTRPTPLLWGCVLTWVFSVLATLMLGASIVVLAADPQLVLDTMHRQNPELATQGVSDHLVLVVGYVTCALFIVWSVAAAVLAVFTLRRNRLAWIALLASTSGVVLVCLLGSLGSLFFVVPLVAGIAAISLLVRPEVRTWIG